MADHVTNKHGVILCVGDKIMDPRYSTARIISEIFHHDDNEATLFMTDGGCIGAEEIKNWSAFVD